MKSPTTALMLVLGTVVSGVMLSVILDNDALLGACTVAAGLITFFHFISVGEKSEPTMMEASLRRAIASAIVVQYLVLVGLVAYFQNDQERLPALTQALINNFTTIVGIVVAFYFGSSAYLDASRIHKTSGPDPRGLPSGTAGGSGGAPDGGATAAVIP